jgi:adenylyl cyclase-associated protein
MATPRRPSANRSAVSSLTDLFHRLEAATSRLEDIATSVATFDQTGSPASGSGLAIASPPPAPTPASQALTAAAPATPSPPPKAQPELPVEVEGFDKLVNGELATFIKLSDALDPLLGQQASLAADYRAGSDEA